MNLPAITEQLTAAGRAIEHDSFAIIDAEAGPHEYAADQWAVVRRLIHTSADFDFNGLTVFHSNAMRAGTDAVHNGATVVTDTEMICVGLSAPRLAHFGNQPRRRGVNPKAVRLVAVAYAATFILFEANCCTS